MKRSVELAPWWYTGGWALAAAYHQVGDHEHSEEWVRKLANSHGHTLGAADYYARTRNVDAMFETLDAAHRQRDASLLSIQSLPSFDPYRADLRFPGAAPANEPGVERDSTCLASHGASPEALRRLRRFFGNPRLSSCQQGHDRCSLHLRAQDAKRYCSFMKPVNS